LRLALDTSVLVAYFLEEDKLHSKALALMNKILSNEIEYVCIGKINLAEIGYILERATNDSNFVYNCLFSTLNEMNLDIIDSTWDFLIVQAHLKAINTISFCDNATLAAASLTQSEALFTKEKEIISKEKDQIKGAKLIFLEDII